MLKEIGLTTVVILQEVVVPILAILLVRVIVPVMKHFYLRSTSESDREELDFWFKFAVEGAEQIYKKNNPDLDRKEYVRHFMESKARELGISLSREEMDAIIESMVYRLNEEQKKNKDLGIRTNQIPIQEGIMIVEKTG